MHAHTTTLTYYSWTCLPTKGSCSPLESMLSKCVNQAGFKCVSSQTHAPSKAMAFPVDGSRQRTTTGFSCRFLAGPQRITRCAVTPSVAPGGHYILCVFHLHEWNHRDVAVMKAGHPGLPSRGTGVGSSADDSCRTAGWMCQGCASLGLPLANTWAQQVHESLALCGLTWDASDRPCLLMALARLSLSQNCTVVRGSS